MSHAKTLNALRPDRNALCDLLFACTLLMAFAAAPLHAQMFQDLYDFNCSTGGCSPNDYGYLTQGKDGNLYGTTGAGGGGSNTAGTIFMVTPTVPVTYTDLYIFDGVNAGTPFAGLTLASDGNFYGTTDSGGPSGFGTVFRFTPPNIVKVLYTFSTPATPAVAPVQAKDGNLYGLTVERQAYRVSLPAGTVTLLPSLAPGSIYDPLFLASDGNLYGVSRTGGTSGLGTVFRMSTTGTFHILHNFTGGATDGANPLGPLTQASNGLLYGTTQAGGNEGIGTVFEISLTGTEKMLHSFVATDGAQPQAGLLAGADGFFYGANLGDGADDFGTLFLVTKGGVVNKLFDFTGLTGAVPGAYPVTTLMAHTNGNFYGTTTESLIGDGNIYSLTPPKSIPILIVEGPIFVHPGVPVQILGNNLEQVTNVSFGGVQAQFRPGSETYLTATVPMLAVDGFISATFSSGLQIQTQSAVHILPLITNLDPSSGPVGAQVAIVGGGFAGATRVTFSGVRSTSFKIVSPGLIQAIVPAGAKTGKVSVTTHNGTAISKETFTVN
jgi:uncharacterized repeat protein (TIGR03803 family)